MGLDVDFIVASGSIKRLEKLLRDQEHGEREEICDDIEADAPRHGIKSSLHPTTSSINASGIADTAVKSGHDDVAARTVMPAAAPAEQVVHTNRAPSEVDSDDECD